MTELAPQADPAEAGLDKERLARIDRHFARYVDDGRLPGWLLTVSRHGRLVHVSRYGAADVEARLRQASALVGTERLAVSPQCGFATSAGGNPVTPQAQRDKLALLVEVAQDFLDS